MPDLLSDVRPRHAARLHAPRPPAPRRGPTRTPHLRPAPGPRTDALEAHRVVRRRPCRPGPSVSAAPSSVGWGTLAPVPAPSSSTPETGSVEEHLLLVAGGYREAFGLVYDALAPLVHGTALAVLRDPDHAAEVTQEVMVEVWRTAPRFEPARGSARAWAATLAHRRAVDRVRSVQAQRRRDQAVLDADTPRPYDEVAEEVEGNLEAARVRHCLGGLTDTQRTAVELAYYGGLSYREVAARLGAALPTVKSRIRDGLLRLRDCLGVS